MWTVCEKRLHKASKSNTTIEIPDLEKLFNAESQKINFKWEESFKKIVGKKIKNDIRCATVW